MKNRELRIPAIRNGTMVFIEYVATVASVPL
jgi:hypothetical protein